MTYNEYGEKVSDGCTFGTHYFHRGVCCPLTKYYDWTLATPACTAIDTDFSFDNANKCDQLDY